MTEEVVKIPGIPSKEVYKSEYDYHKAMFQHGRDFEGLLNSVPKDHKRVKETIQGLFYTKPNKLLDPEKLQVLKNTDPILFGEVSTVYMEYLKKLLGLE